MKAKNSIADGYISDIGMTHPHATAIYRLYRAGILTGNDDIGTFDPENNIRRSEVSAILTRMMNEDSRKDLTLSPEPEPVYTDEKGRILDSWEEIIKSVNDGTYKDKYHIRDTKSLDMGSEGIIDMQIAAFNADELADGSGNASITWIAKQPLKSDHQMNSDISSVTEEEKTSRSFGCWEDSELRVYLKEDLKPLIPDTVKDSIKPVIKYSSSSGVDNTEKNRQTIDDIWIPSSSEVFGSNTYETLGPYYYELFAPIQNRLKVKNNENRLSMWWLRSVSIPDFDSDNFFFKCVSTSAIEESSNSHAWLNQSVVIGFCL